MTILCLEGPSAVGKTTACRALAERHGAFVVPEVNALFQRPAEEPPTWYLERQAERWRIAAKQQAHGLAVLDGDPFQPLWYNWTFGFDRWGSLETLRAFYRPLIASGELAFPDRYILLTAGEEELRRRKDSDASRSRCGFETHLALCDALPRYFAVVSAAAPGLILNLDAADRETIVALIAGAAGGPIGPQPNPLSLFDTITDWLATV
jgi:hypothetical protein